MHCCKCAVGNTQYNNHHNNHHHNTYLPKYTHIRELPPPPTPNNFFISSSDAKKPKNSEYSNVFVVKKTNVMYLRLELYDYKTQYGIYYKSLQGKSSIPQNERAFRTCELQGF